MKMTVKKLAFAAVLVAVALIVYILENLIPLPIAIPGAKLGLANVVTLFALFYGKTESIAAPHKVSEVEPARVNAEPISFSVGEVFLMLIARILLGAMFTGRVTALIYSFAGGLLGFAAQAVMSRFVTSKQIWVCGAVGAVFHNIGQIGAAIIVTGTPAIAAYLPVLVIVGVVTGVVTGLIAQYTLRGFRI